MPKPYLEEFRDDVVAVTRRAKLWLNQIAKDFGISEGCRQGWTKKVDIEDDAGAGPTAAQSAELREAKKESVRLSKRPR